MMADDAPYHAPVYFTGADRTAASTLRDRFAALMAPGSNPAIIFVGSMVEGPVGPHPLPQYEIHFLAPARDGVIALIEQAGLRALIHPLTDDDLADHTTLGHWIGPPLVLDQSVLDPPGFNQGVARFGKSDF
ncbi:MAG: aromatic ring-opening dioxygenase [Proteobacteria bacterium]|nr:aromatic ring-opening dioxygenase [Pseudomonadota bacterium]